MKWLNVDHFCLWCLLVFITVYFQTRMDMAIKHKTYYSMRKSLFLVVWKQKNNHSLYWWFSIGDNNHPPLGTFGNFWRHFWFSQLLGISGILVEARYAVKYLIMNKTGPTTENNLSPNAHCTRLRNPVIEGSQNYWMPNPKIKPLPPQVKKFMFYDLHSYRNSQDHLIMDRHGGAY